MEQRPWYEPAQRKHRDAEHLIAQINAITTGYARKVSENSVSQYYRDEARTEAIAQLRSLDFSLADAERWLDAATRRGRRRR